MKTIIIALMLCLFPFTSAWARWSVTDVTPGNITEQKYGFQVEYSVESNNYAFAVTVSGTTNNPLPREYSADVILSGGISQAIEHSEPHDRDNITSITSRVSLTADQLDSATFCFKIPPPPDSPYARLGGHYFALELIEFIKDEK